VEVCILSVMGSNILQRNASSKTVTLDQCNLKYIIKVIITQIKKNIEKYRVKYNILQFNEKPSSPVLFFYAILALISIIEIYI